MLLDSIIEGISMATRIIVRDFFCWLVYKRWGHTHVYIVVSGLTLFATFAFLIYLTVRYWTSG
jgi:hypothetical protein